MTLLEDLGTMAQVLDGLAAQHRAKGNLDGVVECEFQAGKLRGHATRLAKLLETMEEIGPGAWLGDELRALALPPLAAAAIQESPGMKPGQRCTIPSGHKDPHEHAESAEKIWAKYGDVHDDRCPYIAAPPPADVEVPPCYCGGPPHSPWCARYARCKGRGCDIPHIHDHIEPEAAPTCGTCKGAGELYFDDSGTMARGYMRPCPDCTAPRALQGETKKP